MALEFGHNMDVKLDRFNYACTHHHFKYVYTIGCSLEW
jgi:hypothetical protein